MTGWCLTTQTIETLILVYTSHKTGLIGDILILKYICFSFKQFSPEMFQGHNISTICIYIWNLCFLKTIHNIEKYFNQFHVNLNRKVFFSPVQTLKVFHCSFLWEKLASSLSSTTSDILKDDSNKGIFGEGHHIWQGPFLPPPPPHIYGHNRHIFWKIHIVLISARMYLPFPPPTCAGL